MNVGRDWAGGFGTATPSARATYGHDADALAAPYLPLLRVATALEQRGHRVQFLDAQAERLTAEAALDRLAQSAASQVVVVLNLPSLAGDLALVSRLKQAEPGRRFVAVGTVCKALPGEVLASGAVDVAVRGDPEAAVADLVASPLEQGPPRVPGVAYLENGTLTHAEPVVITTAAGLPAPAYHLAPMDRYLRPMDGRAVRWAPVATGKGCGFACGHYCPYPFGYGTRMLLRDPLEVVEEVARLAADFGVEFVIFRDQLFTASADHAEQVCRGLLGAGVPVRWICETRADRVEAPLLSLMREAGCQAVHYGLESGDPEIFSQFAKPGADLEDVRRAVSDTRRAGLKVHLHVIVGLPGETWGSVRRTLRFLRGVRPDSVQVCLITPYLGTALFEEAGRRGLLLTRDWSRYTGNDVVMRTEQMSGDDLARAARYLAANLWKADPARRVLRRAGRLLGRRSRAGAGQA
jgi:anaerobic magnesium-protoporphyrin IX monomethyl ester cyclase